MNRNRRYNRHAEDRVAAVMSFEEIAQEMGCSTKAARCLLERALGKLRASRVTVRMLKEYVR